MIPCNAMDPGVVIGTFSTVVEAELCRAVLEAADIPAVVVGDHLATAHPALGMSIGVRVVVPPSYEEAAREVLTGLPSSAPANDGPDAA